MSSSSTLRNTGNVKLWTCCECHETRILMTIGDCPHCEHPRCIDCNVKSHAPTSSEISKGVKPAGGIAEDACQLERSSFPSSSRESQPEVSNTSSGGNASSERAYPTRLYPIYYHITINRIENAANHSIFVLRANSIMDKDLASVWNTLLPDITSTCAMICAPLSSIHLLRYGTDEGTSQPTIIVNHKTVLGDDEPSMLQTRIRQIFLQSRVCLPGRLESRSNRSQSQPMNLQLLFKKSRLRRSVASPPNEESLPPICEPRHRKFNLRPETGDSIGILDSFEDTATLGCYLMEGTTPVILTVDHLLPQNLSYSQITHLSLQDQRDLLVPILNAELRQIIRQNSHSCDLCARISGPNRNAPTEEALSNYTMDFLQRRAAFARSSCLIAMELGSAPAFVRGEHQAEPLGSLSCRSFQQPGQCIDELRYTREMDWAIYNLSKEEQRFLLRMQHNQLPPASSAARELRLAPTIVPGAFVKSLGRTSGHQCGQISNTLSTVFHENYTTQEWCVLKRPGTSVEDWVEGGIGVEGDSGGLIVDEITNEIYGMLWGRVGDDAETLTLFTPMIDVLRNIQAKRTRDRGAPTPLPVILRGQIMPDREQASIPWRTIPNVPISLRHFEPEEDEESTMEGLGSAFSFSSLGRREAHASTSTSTSPPRHLPFERYRSHAPGDEIPSPSTSPEEHGRNFRGSGNTSQQTPTWPGSHTYFRYAVADEME